MRGGARGLPRRVPRRPLSPRRASAPKGAPKTPAQGARRAPTPNGTLSGPSGPGDADTRAAPPTRAPAAPQPPRGRPGKFPLGLSFSEGHSGAGDRTAPDPGSGQPAHPPPRHGDGTQRGDQRAEHTDSARPQRPHAGQPRMSTHTSPRDPPDPDPATAAPRPAAPQTAAGSAAERQGAPGGGLLGTPAAPSAGGRGAPRGPGRGAGGLWGAGAALT